MQSTCRNTSTKSLQGSFAKGSYRIAISVNVLVALCYLQNHHPKKASRLLHLLIGIYHASMSEDKITLYSSQTSSSYHQDGSGVTPWLVQAWLGWVLLCLWLPSVDIAITSAGARSGDVCGSRLEVKATSTGWEAMPGRVWDSGFRLQLWASAPHLTVWVHAVLCALILAFRLAAS